MELRWYQKEAVEAIMKAMRSGDNALVQSPTRSGKSVIMAFSIMELLKLKQDMRILIMVESALLVKQLYDTVKGITGITPGLACGSVCEDKQVDKQIVIGTRQTIVNVIAEAEAFNILFIDEAHLVGRRNDNENEEEETGKQYFVIIDTMYALNERLRICGFTATPWGLSYGKLYGEKDGVGQPIFKDLTFRITYESLYTDGSIVPMRGVVVRNGVYTPSGKAAQASTGRDYNMKTVGRERIKYNKSIPEAVKLYCDGHDFIVVFCVDIKNVEDVVAKLIDSGISAVAYHSKVAD